jgi:hypothetical protein
MSRVAAYAGLALASVATSFWLPLWWGYEVVSWVAVAAMVAALRAMLQVQGEEWV